MLKVPEEKLRRIQMNTENQCCVALEFNCDQRPANFAFNTFLLRDSNGHSFYWFSSIYCRGHRSFIISNHSSIETSSTPKTTLCVIQSFLHPVQVRVSDISHEHSMSESLMQMGMHVHPWWLLRPCSKGQFAQYQLLLPEALSCILLSLQTLSFQRAETPQPKHWASDSVGSR